MHLSAQLHWLLVGLFTLASLPFSGCVMSNKSHHEKVRTITLDDFAGTYQNRADPAQGYAPFNLTDIVWPKHPPVSPGRDYHSIDRIKVTVDGKKITLRFMARGSLFDQVTYQEGKDFRLSDSTVALEAQAGATATKGSGQEMTPLLPFAGAIVRTGNLFLNPNRDLVVRLDSTAAMMVFYVAPAVVRSGKDVVFRRISEVEDRLPEEGASR